MVSTTGDVVELRRFEKIEFSDGSYDVESGEFTPNSATLELNVAGEIYEGQDITIEATLDKPANETMNITLSHNGESVATITIAKGESSASVTFENPNEEDVYLDAETLEYSVEVSGGFNENTNIEKPSSIKVVLDDTIYTTKETLNTTIHNFV